MLCEVHRQACNELVTFRFEDISILISLTDKLANVLQAYLKLAIAGMPQVCRQACNVSKFNSVWKCTGKLATSLWHLDLRTLYCHNPSQTNWSMCCKLITSLLWLATSVQASLQCFKIQICLEVHRQACNKLVTFEDFVIISLTDKLAIVCCKLTKSLPIVCWQACNVLNIKKCLQVHGKCRWGLEKCNKTLLTVDSGVLQWGSGT